MADYGTTTVAKLLDRQPATVLRAAAILRAQGKPCGYRAHLGGVWLFRPEDIERLRARNTRRGRKRRPATVGIKAKDIPFPGEVLDRLPGVPDPLGEVEYGGTDAKTVMLQNRYSSLYQLFCDKTGQRTSKSLGNPIAARIGHYYEEPLIRLVRDGLKDGLEFDARDEAGNSVALPGWDKVYVTSKLYRLRAGSHYLSAHVDGWGQDAEGKNFLVEAKNYSSFAHGSYDEIEMSEVFQVQHYLSIFRPFFQYAVLIVQINNTIRVFRLEIDDTIGYDLKWEIEKFHTDFVIKKTAPEVEAQDLDAIKETTPPEAGKTVKDDEKKDMLNKLISVYTETQNLQKKTGETLAKIKAEIVSILGGCEEYASSAGKITYKTVEMKRVDTAKMKTAGIYGDYTKTDSQTRLTVKGAKDA